MNKRFSDALIDFYGGSSKKEENKDEEGKHSPADSAEERYRQVMKDTIEAFKEQDRKKRRIRESHKTPYSRQDQQSIMTQAEKERFFQGMGIKANVEEEPEKK